MEMAIQLDNWQKEVLAYEGDILLCTGRRVGKTYILARKAIDLMVKRANTPIIIISLTEDQAKIILSMALNYLKEKYPSYLGKGRAKPTMKQVTLINKSKMIVRPVGNTGNGARGFEGGVLIVDEASRMPKMFWLAAKPILLTTNGQIWIGSTPFGKEGYFWERFNEAYNLKDPNSRFKVFYISSEEAILNRPISDTWTIQQSEGAKRILEQERIEMSKAEYAQEYLGLFSDDVNQFYPDELIQELCCLERMKRRGDKFAGIDCAGFGEDKSTIEIFDKDRYDNLNQVENIILKNTYTTQLSDKILDLDKIYDFKGIGVDDGGVGFGVFSELMNIEETKRKTEALNNSRRPIDREGKKSKTLLKEEMHNNLKTLMIRRKIRFLNDDNIKNSLKSIQWEVVRKENQEPRTRIFGRDSHIAEGIVRAVQMATQSKNLNIWISTIRI